MQDFRNLAIWTMVFWNLSGVAKFLLECGCPETNTAYQMWSDWCRIPPLSWAFCLYCSVLRLHLISKQLHHTIDSFQLVIAWKPQLTQWFVDLVNFLFIILAFQICWDICERIILGAWQFEKLLLSKKCLWFFLSWGSGEWWDTVTIH